ncbi:fused PTS fructose transporter subunit IIA/HPr protein [Bisgaard Taxon 10/6]|uniref:fused PTS fructose transporter subunit IIA/HPr protein n=1 Tax=Exercitatus varius TaxID=67857 RepID=UPI00294B8CDB|nr:fused PTS fructose transporter subunit IIA/HPr protein [Exercitatus varius]MDG2960659.1 fused PTS fructose transporter subunit IIA/HPr protein [Exercitatus varius]
MFNLPENNIHLAAQATDKQQAIEMAAAALEQAGYVESGYLQGMLGREQQTSTFLGNGIAIPHGTLETRGLVKNTGVAVFQFPQGVEWGEGNKAYVVIGIAARSDEHLALLRQLTHVLGDEDTAAELATMDDVKKFRAILMGEAENFSVKAETISLNVDTTSLLTLTAINAAKLQEQSAVENSFVSDVIGSPALPLGNGLWLTDSAAGNAKNALAFSRARNAFEHNGKTVQAVLTVAVKDDAVNETLARLLDANVQEQLLTGSQEQILAALNGEELVVNAKPAQAAGTVIGTFTLRNEHGLHARPSTILVNTLKSFEAKITVENLTRGGLAVNAKSAMKLVGLGATKNHRLRFVAQGDDAKQAMDALAKAFSDGLGEGVSAVPPAESTVGATEKNEAKSDEGAEGIFVLNNEHGLHARPSAVLVNEVKKYNASVAVQNLDRNTQLVSAKSLMKIVALGAVKGHRLRFVATGEEAQQAIDGIGAVIAAGLGE